MSTTVSGLRLRQTLGKSGWLVPDPFGPDGRRIDARDGKTRVIVTTADHDHIEWTHASISHPHVMPSYDELKRLHTAVWPLGWAYQVFAPPTDHVNIHEYALHLWGRSDGSSCLPNFGVGGSI